MSIGQFKDYSLNVPLAGTFSSTITLVGISVGDVGQEDFVFSMRGRARGVSGVFELHVRFRVLFLRMRCAD